MKEISAGGKKKFSYAKIWWIGFGFLGVQLAFTTYNAFLPLMYREFFESRALVGLLMGTDNLIGLLLIPIIGAWSDRINSPWGRRLPFIVIAIPIAALTHFAIPLVASILFLLIITEIVFTAAMHSYRGPVISLMPDHTPPEKRSVANGIINLMGGVGTLISFGVLALLYDIDPRMTFGIGSGVLTSFAASFLVLALFAGYVGTKIGKIPAMLWGLVILPVLFLLAIPVRDPWIISGIFVLGGLGWALVNVQAMPLIADFGGRDRVGFYIGLYYVFTMIGQMIGPFFLRLSMDIIGNKGMFIAGAAFFFLANVMLRTGQKKLGTDPLEMARQGQQFS